MKEKILNFFKNIPSLFKKLKGNKIKNTALFKRGGYSFAITALVLAVLILFNWLVAVLSERFHLEYDMSPNKFNSISKENIEYIEALDSEVDVTFCANKDEYVSYMSYYAQNFHQAEGDTSYYEQTLKLVEKYGEYNEKININYVDPQTTEFTKISQEYSKYKLSYGDILVTAEKGNEERIKKITFEDIYTLSDPNGYAAQGYGAYSISGNNIETCLTSAIAYVVSNDIKSVAVITGHSTSDNSSGLVSMLKTNNYEVTVIEDAIVSSISDEFDAVAILSPDKDFISEEIKAISSFLDNKGKLNKGLLFFADATCPNLPNLNEFLTQWGIKISDGILFETNNNNHIDGDNTTLGIYPDTELEDEVLSGVSYCITGYNVPITECKAARGAIKTKILLKTPESVAVAPIGAKDDWKDYKEEDLASYAGIIESSLTEYGDDNKEMSSYVIAFSSVEFIQSEWAEYDALSNKDITLGVSDRAAGVEDTGISFVAKQITNESFADSVTAEATNAIRIIFMIALPVLMVALGIYIYIRRKNA